MTIYRWGLVSIQNKVNGSVQNARLFLSAIFCQEWQNLHKKSFRALDVQQIHHGKTNQGLILLKYNNLRGK